MKKLITLALCITLFGCKVEQISKPIPHDCSGFEIDTIFIEGEHIHINEEYLCGWTGDVAMITMESDSEFYLYEIDIVIDNKLQTWRKVNK